MALICCIECNEKISEHAKSCPHCGIVFTSPQIDQSIQQRLTEQKTLDKINGLNKLLNDVYKDSKKISAVLIDIGFTKQELDDLKYKLDIFMDNFLSLFIKRNKTYGSDFIAKIIVSRYGLRDGQVNTLEDIGTSFKITQERARQLQIKLLKEMKFYLKKMMVDAACLALDKKNENYSNLNLYGDGRVYLSRVMSSLDLSISFPGINSKRLANELFKEGYLEAKVSGARLQYFTTEKGRAIGLKDKNKITRNMIKLEKSAQEFIISYLKDKFPKASEYKQLATKDYSYILHEDLSFLTNVIKYINYLTGSKITYAEATVFLIFKGLLKLNDNMNPKFIPTDAGIVAGIQIVEGENASKYIKYNRQIKDYLIEHSNQILVFLSSGDYKPGKTQIPPSSKEALFLASFLSFYNFNNKTSLEYNAVLKKLIEEKIVEIIINDGLPQSVILEKGKEKGFVLRTNKSHVGHQEVIACNINAQEYLVELLKYMEACNGAH